MKKAKCMCEYMPFESATQYMNVGSAAAEAWIRWRRARTELPAGVSGLDTGLAHVKRDGFAHFEVVGGGVGGFGGVRL